MKKYLGEYLEYLAMRGMSPRTIFTAKRSINYFYNYLKQKKTTKVNRDMFQKYQNYQINERKYKPYTYRGRLIQIRSYFNYLVRTKRMLFNPAQDLKLPKQPKILPRDIPTASEMEKMLNAIDTVGRVGKRRKAILELLYSTGIRARELLNLELYDVNFKAKTITVRGGKGNKDRVVPFGKSAAIALKNYIQNARKYHAEMTGETKLFLSMWGRKFKYKEFLLVMHGFGNGRRVHAHAIRHACAIGMLQNGADIRYIQELLGHRSINSTQIYTRILPRQLQEVHAKCHPRSRIKPRSRS